MKKEENLKSEPPRRDNKLLNDGSNHYSYDITIMLRLINYGVITYIFIDNRCTNNELPTILISSAISSLIALIADFLQIGFSLWEHRYCLYYHKQNPNKSENNFDVDYFSKGLRRISDFLFKMKIFVTFITILLFIIFIYSKFF